MFKVADHQEAPNELILTIEGASPAEIISRQARDFAYQARHQYGFSEAGIESAGGPYPINKNTGNVVGPNNIDSQTKEAVAQKDIAFRKQFKLQRPL